jgi:MoxR-like ATPase
VGVNITLKALALICKLNQKYFPDLSSPDRDITFMDKAASWLGLETGRRGRSLARQRQLICELCNTAVAVRREKDEEAAVQIGLRIQEEIARFCQMSVAAQIPVPEEIDEGVVAKLFSDMTGIPLGELNEGEKKRILGIRGILDKRIVGQARAKEAVARAVIRNAAGTVKGAPVKGVFLFLGPTGVGKTELAKVLGKFLFKRDENFLQINMGEFGEKHMIASFLGSPPGYQDSDRPGRFEVVRKRKYCLVLFDEVEKAHPDVWKILLSLLAEGSVTDAMGRKISFKDTYVVMTSNLGAKEMGELYERFEDKYAQEISREYQRAIEEKNADVTQQEAHDQCLAEATVAANKWREVELARVHEKTQQIGKQEVEKTFPPELVGRIIEGGEFIGFNSFITNEDREALFDIHQEIVCDPQVDAGYQLLFSKTAKEKIILTGFSSKQGARPLKGAFRRLVADPLAELQLMEEYSDGTPMRRGDTILVDRDGEEIVFKKGKQGKDISQAVKLGHRERQIWQDLDRQIGESVASGSELTAAGVEESLTAVRLVLPPADFSPTQFVDLAGFFVSEIDPPLKAVVSHIFSRAKEGVGQDVARAAKTFILMSAALAKQAVAVKLDRTVKDSPISKVNPCIRTFEDLLKIQDLEIRSELAKSLIQVEGFEDEQGGPPNVLISYETKENIDVQVEVAARLPVDISEKMSQLFSLVTYNQIDSAGVVVREGWDPANLKLLEAIRVLREAGVELGFYEKNQRTIFWCRIAAGNLTDESY